MNILFVVAEKLYVGESEGNDKFQGVHEHRGLIGDAPDLQPANKLDPVYEVGGPSMRNGGPHNTHIHRGSISGGSTLEAAEKLDPPEDVMGSSSSKQLPSRGDTVTRLCTSRIFFIYQKIGLTKKRGQRILKMNLFRVSSGTRAVS